MKNLCNIQRMDDYRSTYGWVVRVRRRWKGRQIYIICHLFSDNIYGGKRESLEKAKEYRDLSTSFFPPRCLENKKFSYLLTLPCFLGKSKEDVKKKLQIL